MVLVHGIVTLSHTSRAYIKILGVHQQNIGTCLAAGFRAFHEKLNKFHSLYLFFLFYIFTKINSYLVNASVVNDQGSVVQSWISANPGLKI